MNFHQELGRFDINYDTGEVYLSPEFADIVRLSDSYAADFHKFLKCIHPDDRSAMTAIRNKLLTAAPSDENSLEIRVFGEDGKTRRIWVTSRSFGHDTLSGPAECVLGFVAENVHESANPVHRGTPLVGARRFSLPALGAFCVNVRSGVDIWTPEFAAIFGLPATASSGFETVFKHVHPEDRSAVISTLKVVMSPERPRVALRHRVIREDGGERFVHMAGRTIFNTKSGDAVCFVGIVADITDCRQRPELLCVRPS